MKRETLYKVAAVVLLTVNLVLISFFFLNKKPQKKHNKDRKPHAQEILNLDHNQDTQFREFSKKHHETMVLLQDEQKQYVRNYFLNPSDSLLNLITAIEVKKIKTTENHFKNMKSVLKEDQLPYYEEFRDKVLKYILR